MQTSLSYLRHLSPLKHDRIVDLIKREYCDQSFIKQAVSVLQMISVYSVIDKTKSQAKFESFISIIENHILKLNGFNMLIRNVPNFAELCEGSSAPIKYIHMRETLQQFGKLNSFHMIRGTVYVKFSDHETSVSTCSKINNMLMGPNKLAVEVI